MKFLKLNVSSFGKLSDREFKLNDGINVIYGPNESGKSTILSFIRFILYGCSGRKSVNNITFEEKYTPWNNSAMSGSIEFELDGKKYLASRSHGIKKEHNVISLMNGESAFEGANPGNSIYKMNESAFIRSFYVSSESCSITTDKNDDIVKGLTNLAQTGDESLSYGAACTKIKSDKKTVTNKINDIDNEILTLRRKLEKITKLKERSKILDEQLVDIVSHNDMILSEEQDAGETAKKYQHFVDKYASVRISQSARVISLCIMSFLALILAILQFYLLCLIPVVFGLFTIMFIVIGNKKLKLLKNQIRNYAIVLNKSASKTKNERQIHENYKNDILKEIGAIEAELEYEYDYNDIYVQIDNLTEQKKLLNKRIKVLDKASYILDESYNKLKDIFSPLLNEKASVIFSALTGEKYNDIIISDSFDIKAKEEYDYKSHKMYSTSTYEMMYLSLRLALCEILSGDNSLPIFLDDCFATCDDDRIKTIVAFLSEYVKDGKQVVFCTCHERERDLFKNIEGINIIDLTFND